MPNNPTHLTLVTDNTLAELSPSQIKEFNHQHDGIRAVWPDLQPDHAALVLSTLRVNLATNAHLSQLIQVTTENVLFNQDQLTPEQQMERMESVVEMNNTITHALRRMTDAMDKLFKV